MLPTSNTSSRKAHTSEATWLRPFWCKSKQVVSHNQHIHEVGFERSNFQWIEKASAEALSNWQMRRISGAMFPSGTSR